MEGEEGGTGATEAERCAAEGEGEGEGGGGEGPTAECVGPASRRLRSRSGIRKQRSANAEKESKAGLTTCDVM